MLDAKKSKIIQFGEINLKNQGTRTPSFDSNNSNGEGNNLNHDLKFLDGSNLSSFTETSSEESSENNDDTFFNKSDLNKSI